MKPVQLLLFCAVFFCSSCSKSKIAADIAGECTWIIQYTNNPSYTSTPQSSGIAEIMWLNTNSTYSVKQNGNEVNTGTYKVTKKKSSYGGKVPGILFTNSRVTDSAAYFTLDNDSLFFSNDLIGTIGSGSRHYGRIK